MTTGNETFEQYEDRMRADLARPEFREALFQSSFKFAVDTIAGTAQTVFTNDMESIVGSKLFVTTHTARIALSFASLTVALTMGANGFVKVMNNIRSGQRPVVAGSVLPSADDFDSIARANPSMFGDDFMDGISNIIPEIFYKEIISNCAGSNVLAGWIASGMIAGALGTLSQYAADDCIESAIDGAFSFINDSADGGAIPSDPLPHFALTELGEDSIEATETEPQYQASSTEAQPVASL